MKSSIMIKSSSHGLVVYLDASLPFPELLDAVERKFRESAAFFKNAKMALTLRGRVLDAIQEKEIVDTIVESSGIHVLCLVDEDQVQDEHYRSILEHAEEAGKQDKGQFYRGTLLSGQSLEMEKSIIVLGDVNPGASIVSKGNIIVLGSCMGNIYAGAGGDRSCFAAALMLKPNQIRIADKMARSAITKKEDTGEYNYDPMIAFVKNDHIYVKQISQDTYREIKEE